MTNKIYRSYNNAWLVHALFIPLRMPDESSLNYYPVPIMKYKLIIA